jgi:cytochrome c oxidase subunit 2
VLPANREVEFHVTSLDVIHDFWAYKLGVKADANPGVDNVAFVKPTKLENFTVRCAELCGIWHGYMSNAGKVVTPAAFETWIHHEQTRLAPATKVLPKYSTTYLPEPTRRGE